MKIADSYSRPLIVVKVSVNKLLFQFTECIRNLKKLACLKLQNVQFGPSAFATYLLLSKNHNKKYASQI